jgi:hypothetical protein
MTLAAMPNQAPMKTFAAPAVAVGTFAAPTATAPNIPSLSRLEKGVRTFIQGG